jgi:hypothetical protein
MRVGDRFVLWIFSAVFGHVAVEDRHCERALKVLRAMLKDKCPRLSGKLSYQAYRALVNEAAERAAHKDPQMTPRHGVFFCEMAKMADSLAKMELGQVLSDTRLQQIVAFGADDRE